MYYQPNFTVNVLLHFGLINNDMVNTSDGYRCSIKGSQYSFHTVCLEIPFFQYISTTIYLPGDPLGKLYIQIEFDNLFRSCLRS